MPDASLVYAPEKQEERAKLFQDPAAKALLKGLMIGPGDRATYGLVTTAARLFQLGLDLLETIESAAEPPPIRDLESPRVFRHVRRGDRFRLADCEAWTDLSDGAAVEAALLLDQAFPGSAFLSAVRSLTPNGLRSAGRSGVMWLVSELDSVDRAKLAEALSRPIREMRPARVDRSGLQRIAKALRAIASRLEEG